MIRFIGLRQYQAALTRSAQKIKPEASKNMEGAAKLVQKTSRSFIRGSSRRGRRSTSRFLANESGRLKRSITFDVFRRGKTIFAEIGSSLIYSRIHELGGTVNGRRIPARPYLEPALKKTAADVFKRIGRTFRVVG